MSKRNNNNKKEKAFLNSLLHSYTEESELKAKNLYGIIPMFREYLSFLHTPYYYNGSSDSTNGLYPIRYDDVSNSLQFYQGTAWTNLGAQGLQEVTHAEILVLISSETLIPGVYYHITDGGVYSASTNDAGDGSSVIVQAFSNNTLSPEGVRKMLCPTRYNIEVVDGVDWQGVWTISKGKYYYINEAGPYIGLGQTITGNNSGATGIVTNNSGTYFEFRQVSGSFQDGEPITSDGGGTAELDFTTPPIPISALMIYGGMVWRNLTGLIGINLDGFSLDITNWELVSKLTFSQGEYVEKTFEVLYDVENNWIAKQWDTNNNILGGTYNYTLIDNAFTQNLADVSDWNALSGFVNKRFYGNQCSYINNNIFEVEIVGNIMPFAAITNNDCYSISGNIVLSGSNSGEGIYNNLIQGEITDNIVYGSISFNRNSAGIYQNRVENIYENTTSGGIYGNTNTGSIYSNSNDGDIFYNSNLGNITSNSVDGDIENNSNTGNIDSNSNGGGILRNSNNGDIQYNENNGNISRNSNSGDIDTNSNDGAIYNNTNLGGIGNNTNTGSIYQNSNTSEIYSNLNVGNIINNSNNGGIASNENVGHIGNNSNNGSITFISNTTTDITYNINNGIIGFSVVGPISDPVVDK